MKTKFKLLLVIPLMIISLNAISGELEDVLSDYEYTEQKIKEHSKILENYENNSHYYGRTGLDIQSHTKANLRMYNNQLIELSSKIESLKYSKN